MNVFGQVWLWTLLAFAVGVLLTWFVMVRPARKQVADLEDQLLEARSRPVAPIGAPAADDDLERDFKAAEWDDTPSRSLSDEVLAPAPYAEPPAYFGAPVAAPAVVEEPEPEPEPEREPEPEPEPEAPAAPPAPLMSSEEAQRRFEEQLSEQKAIADASPGDDDRPRSLFERLSPGDVPEEHPAERTTVLNLSGLEAADFDDEPELPAEQTSFVPAYEPTAEVAPSMPEPTAPPEVDERGDFIYQPREVWGSDEQEAFLDEAGEQEDEPARSRGRSTASEQTTFIAVEESAWPANDLTGEYPGLRDELSGRLDNFTEPETPAEQTLLVEPMDLDAPHVRNGVFESTHDTFAQPETEQHEAYEPHSHARYDSEPAHTQYEPDSAPSQPEVFEQEHAQEAFEPEPAQAQYEPFEPEAAHAQPEVFEPEPAPYSHAQPEPFQPEPAPRSHALPEPFQPAPARRSHALPEPFQPEPAQHSRALREPFQAEEYSEPAASAGAFSAFGDTTDTPDRQPHAVAAAFDHQVEAPPAPPQPPVDRPRSLFEPLLDADEPLPATGQTRKLPEPTNDQPFVPKFVPSDEPLLAAAPEPEPEPVESDLPQRVSEAGLPIREARRTTMQRQQSFPAFQAFEAPKPEAPQPEAALPARPRPVGFSPSTRGRPNGTAPGSSRFQQPEGFNPRSPFGPGSVLPRSDGMAPAQDFAVKATLTGRRYYTAASANFVETRADVWFRTESDAQKAGFRPSP